MNKEQIRQTVIGLGADFCGFAPINRFENTTIGFRPSDIIDNARCVIVFGRRVPNSVFNSKSPVPYIKTNNTILEDLVNIGIKASIILEDNGIMGLPIPSEPYEYWEPENKKGKAILSLKEAGYYAGLGGIGKNNLLTNKRYGNRILLNAIIIDREYVGDKIDDNSFCKESCTLCVDNCPAKAITDDSVNQKGCREASEFVNKKGYFLYVCNECRKNCPVGLGF